MFVTNELTWRVYKYFSKKLIKCVVLTKKYVKKVTRTFKYQSYIMVKLNYSLM